MLRDKLPAMSAIYGLKWADIETMPMLELVEYLEDLTRRAEHAQAQAQAQQPFSPGGPHGRQA